MVVFGLVRNVAAVRSTWLVRLAFVTILRAVRVVIGLGVFGRRKSELYDAKVGSKTDSQLQRHGIHHFRAVESCSICGCRSQLENFRLFNDSYECASDRVVGRGHNVKRALVRSCTQFLLRGAVVEDHAHQLRLGSCVVFKLRGDNVCDHFGKTSPLSSPLEEDSLLRVGCSPAIVAILWNVDCQQLPVVLVSIVVVDCVSLGQCAGQSELDEKVFHRNPVFNYTERVRLVFIALKAVRATQLTQLTRDLNN